MYNDILLILASLLNVCGTIYAVLSILALTPKDVYKSITLKGIDERNLELIIQKKQARLGITLIVTAWIFQCVFTVFQVNSSCCFWLCITSTIIVMLLELLVMGAINKRFEKKCHDYEKEQRH